MSVAELPEDERTIVSLLVKRLFRLPPPVRIKVFDGEAITPLLRGKGAVEAAIGATDETTLYISYGKQRGFVYLVHGLGDETISDYSMDMDVAVRCSLRQAGGAS